MAADQPTTAAQHPIEAARALCDETGADEPILDAIAHAYFSTWQAMGNRHINQWPVALIALAAIRRAGYDVVKVADDGE